MFVVLCLNHITEATNYDLPVTVSPFTLLKLPTFYLNGTNSCNIEDVYGFEQMLFILFFGCLQYCAAFLVFK